MERKSFSLQEVDSFHPAGSLLKEEVKSDVKVV